MLHNKWNRSSRRKLTGKDARKMEITHALVMDIANRVYDLLRRDLKLERERARFLDRRTRRYGGKAC